MRAELHIPRGERFYESALEGLARVNTDLYRDKRLPSIYAGGVKYQREQSEEWRNVEEVLGSGWGDCEDLAAARVGELRASGDQAHVIVRRTGPKMTHALVQRGNGTIEDPSRRLGMGRDAIGGDMSHEYPGYDELGASFNPIKRFLPANVAKTIASARPIVQVGPAPLTQAASWATPPVPDASVWGHNDAPLTAPSGPREPYEIDTGRSPYETGDTGQDDYGDQDGESEWGLTGGDEDWEGIGADPSASPELSWTVDRTATGWKGVVRIPLDAGRAMFVTRTAATKPEAAKSALKAASGVLDSDLAKTLIPPQALAALNVLRSPTAQKAAKVAFDTAKKLKFW